MCGVSLWLSLPNVAREATPISDVADALRLGRPSMAVTLVCILSERLQRRTDYLMELEMSFPTLDVRCHIS